ncbi:hypothetical protein GGD71_005765 [Variovorax guangxiensis]|uniref:Uncharacterized protein n=2 Tax=Variovorax guangxiensis TaxID=1775474 RepID=A0A840FQU5_9BURK|nr:hypothetical protein [Variovorax guangxiensis]
MLLFKLLFRMTVSRQAPQDLLPVVVVAVHLHVLDAQPATLERLHARVVDKGDHLGGTFSAAAEVCFVVRVAAAGVAITTPAPGGVPSARLRAAVHWTRRGRNIPKRCVNIQCCFTMDDEISTELGICALDSQGAAAIPTRRVRELERS